MSIESPTKANTEHEMTLKMLARESGTRPIHSQKEIKRLISNECPYKPRAVVSACFPGPGGFEEGQNQKKYTKGKGCGPAYRVDVHSEELN